MRFSKLVNPKLYKKESQKMSTLWKSHDLPSGITPSDSMLINQGINDDEIILSAYQVESKKFVFYTLSKSHEWNKWSLEIYEPYAWDILASIVDTNNHILYVQMKYDCSNEDNALLVIDIARQVHEKYNIKDKIDPGDEFAEMSFFINNGQLNCYGYGCDRHYI